MTCTANNNIQEIMAILGHPMYTCELVLPLRCSVCVNDALGVTITSPPIQHSYNIKKILQPISKLMY